MHAWKLPREQVDNPKTDSLVLADELEDIILDNQLIQTNKTLVYDYLNLDQYVPQEIDGCATKDDEKKKKNKNKSQKLDGSFGDENELTLSFEGDENLDESTNDKYSWQSVSPKTTMHSGNDEEEQDDEMTPEEDHSNG